MALRRLLLRLLLLVVPLMMLVVPLMALRRLLLRLLLMVVPLMVLVVPPPLLMLDCSATAVAQPAVLCSATQVRESCRTSIYSRCICKCRTNGFFSV